MDSPSDRLDEAIETRRLDLDLNLNDVAAASKISPATLRAIRRGTNQPSALTKRRIEDTLQWEHGSIEAILAGGEPSPIEAQPPSEFDQYIATTNAVLDVIEKDPKARARLRRILEAGSGQPPELHKSDEEGGSHRDVAG